MRKKHFFRKGDKILSQGIMKGVLSLSAVSLLFFASCSKDEVNAENPIEQNNSLINQANAARVGTGNYYANQIGTDNYNYFFTIDKDGGEGSAFLNFNGSGTTAGKYSGNFYMQWNSVKQVVGGKGWPAGSGRTVNYNVGSLSGDDVKFVGVYGWVKSPLTEYYVCEMGPGAVYNKGGVLKTYSSNGHTYSIAKSQRINKPSIESINSTFWQVESRWGGASRNVSYSMNMQTHFNNFRAALGGQFGTTFNGDRTYMVFGCEAYNYNTRNTSGSMNATIW
jgi:endo-1,4-beta-xylanase